MSELAKTRFAHTFVLDDSSFWRTVRTVLTDDADGTVQVELACGHEVNLFGEDPVTVEANAAAPRFCSQCLNEFLAQTLESA